MAAYHARIHGSDGQEDWNYSTCSLGSEYIEGDLHAVRHEMKGEESGVKGEMKESREGKSGRQQHTAVDRYHAGHFLAEPVEYEDSNDQISTQPLEYCNPEDLDGALLEYEDHNTLIVSTQMEYHGPHDPITPLPLRYGDPSEQPYSYDDYSQLDPHNEDNHEDRYEYPPTDVLTEDTHLAGAQYPEYHLTTVTRNLGQLHLSDPYSSPIYSTFPPTNAIVKLDTTSSRAEDLYQIESRHHFWETGRIFAVPDNTTLTTVTTDDKPTSSHAAWYFVVTGRSMYAHKVTCHPISSYSCQGFAAEGVDAANHVPVYHNTLRPPVSPPRCPLVPLRFRGDKTGLPSNALVLLDRVFRFDISRTKVMSVGVLEGRSDRALRLHVKKVDNEGSTGVCNLGDKAFDLQPEVVLHGVKEVVEGGLALGATAAIVGGFLLLSASVVAMEENRHYL